MSDLVPDPGLPGLRGARIARIALVFEGCSARADPERYLSLMLRPSDTVSMRAYYLNQPFSGSFSTCGLTVLAVWRLAGCQEPEVVRGYVAGRAFSDLETVAMRAGAWEAGKPASPLKAGDAFVIVDGSGDGHVGLCVRDQDSLFGPLETVEGANSTASARQPSRPSRGRKPVSSFPRVLGSRWARATYMASFARIVSPYPTSAFPRNRPGGLFLTRLFP